MGGNPQIALAESYENDNMENGVRGKLPELHPVNKEQPTEEFVGWKGKTVEEESKKHYPPSFQRIWDLLVARELVLHAIKKPLVLQLLDICLRDQRFSPVTGLVT